MSRLAVPALAIATMLGGENRFRDPFEASLPPPPSAETLPLIDDSLLAMHTFSSLTTSPEQGGGQRGGRGRQPSIPPNFELFGSYHVLESTPVERGVLISKDLQGSFSWNKSYRWAQWDPADKHVGAWEFTFGRYSGEVHPGLHGALIRNTVSHKLYGAQLRVVADSTGEGRFKLYNVREVHPPGRRR